MLCLVWQAQALVSEVVLGCDRTLWVLRVHTPKPYQQKPLNPLAMIRPTFTSAYLVLWFSGCHISWQRSSNLCPLISSHSWVQPCTKDVKTETKDNKSAWTKGTLLWDRNNNCLQDLSCTNNTYTCYCHMIMKKLRNSEHHVRYMTGTIKMRTKAYVLSGRNFKTNHK